MKRPLNKTIQLLLFFTLLNYVNLYSSSFEINGYKLEINEKSGRFSLSKENEDGKFINTFAGSNSRTSTFSVYENNGFYALGDTFRYKRTFTEKEDGGVFSWVSKDLFIEQTFSLDRDGLLEINLSITNISTASKSAGLKYVIDTDFEDEDYFFLKAGNGGIEIDSEYEVENPELISYWTSGVRNSKGVSLMSIPTATTPSRIIFGNWDLLDDADFYYKTVSGRVFNNPPYSINDNAVLFFFSPKDILPQNSLNYSLCFRAIDTVENHNEIVLIQKPIEEIEEDGVLEDTIETIENDEPSRVEIIEDPVIIVEEPVKVDEATDELQEIEETLVEDDIEPEPIISEPERIESPDNTIPEIAIDEDIEPISEIAEKIETIGKIRKMIDTLSRPGIITESNLNQLEELIRILEELDINEN